MRLLFLFLLCMITIMGSAQNTVSTQYVELHDGSIIKAQQINQTTSTTQLTLTNGSTLIIDNKDIKSISPTHSIDKSTKNTSKWYGVINLSAMGAQASQYEGNTVKEHRYGLGASVGMGYKLHPYLHTGIGLGIDLYDIHILPIYLDISSQLPNKRVSPTLRMQTGYGIATSWSSPGYEEIDNVKGGFYWHPSIGLSINNSSNNTKISFDIGYKFQHALKNYTQVWEGHYHKDDITFKSMTFRMGLVF